MKSLTKVSQQEFARFLAEQPCLVENAIEAITMSVMQYSTNDVLLAQAIYKQVPFGPCSVEYRILAEKNCCQE